MREVAWPAGCAPLWLPAGGAALASGVGVDVVGAAVGVAAVAAPASPLSSAWLRCGWANTFGDTNTIRC